MNKPKLRFKGFYNDWKEGKLEDFCIINPNSSSLPDTFYYIDLECVENGRIVSDLNAIDKVNAPSRAQRVLAVNDLLYQMVRPYQRNNFLFIQEKELPTVASTGYAQVRTKDNDIRFLYQKLHTDSFVKCAMQRSTGTGYPAINSTDLATINIKLPEIDEQKKIAEFLSKVDEVIAEREEEVKDLEKQKKGLMQKIFSQELRFTDSNNNPYPDWKEKKIGDLCTINGRIGFRGYTTADIVSKEEGVISLSPSNIVDSRLFLDKENTYISYFKYEESPEIKVYNDDVIFVKTGSTFGKVALVKGLNEPATLNPQLIVLKNFRGILPYIMSTLISRPEIQKQVQQAKGGGVVPTLTQKEFSNYKLKLPCLEEQQKIANVLSKLDELIEEKKALLSDWQSFKKGLLQQMFV